MTDIKDIICHWSSYTGSHCRRNINHTEKCPSSFCKLHQELIEEYKLIKSSKDSENDLCETFEEFKIVPRSFKHVRSVMASLNNEDEKVDVYMPGGLIEEAEIQQSYIMLLSDSCKYYYIAKKGEHKAKDLKIILRRHCPNNCIVCIGDTKYCEECYRKLKNVPRISVLR